MPENKFQVIPLRAFKDNYVWTLRNAEVAAVVRGERGAVEAFRGLRRLAPGTEQGVA